jgi:hypothetical protein
MRTNLGLAFQEMRRQGLLARMNFTCCLTCGGLAMMEQAIVQKRAGTEVKGCCYYTQPDEADRLAGRDFKLAFGPVRTPCFGTLGLDVEKVGKLVIRCLAKYGVDYHWDGDPGHRILVKTHTIKRVPQEQAARFKLPKVAPLRFGGPWSRSIN